MIFGRRLARLGLKCSECKNRVGGNGLDEPALCGKCLVTPYEIRQRELYGCHTALLLQTQAQLDAEAAKKKREEHVAMMSSKGSGLHRKAFKVLAVLVLCPLVAQASEEPSASIEIVAAAGVSLSDESGAIPSVTITTNTPLPLGHIPVCRLSVSLALMGLPGESVGLREPETWKSAEVFAELQRRVGVLEYEDGSNSSTYIIGRAGFHTRILPRDKTPRDRFARSYGVGLRAERRDASGSIRRSIALLYGRSDVASPKFGKGQIMVEGHAKIATLAGVDLIVGGDAYLNVSRQAGRGSRDVLRAWVGGAWGG